MDHKKIAAFALLLLALALSTCDLVPTPMPTSTPTKMPTPTATLTDKAFRAAEECAQQWENTQKSDYLDCAIRHYQEAIDLLDNDDSRRPHYQFRFDRLLWLSGQRETPVRERILGFIRQNLDDEEAANFFFGRVLPEPRPADIGESFSIYKNEWKAPHFAIAQYGAQIETSETHVPGSVYEGHSSLQIKWDKSSRTWANLVIGFDPHIADADRAKAGELLSLNLDRLSKNDYRLEFAVRAGPGVDQWGEPIIRIKLQDQNLIIGESIGNQLVCHIKLTEEWTIYSIPLGEFVTDRWILELYADDSLKVFEDRPWLAFDWSRVKQISFDVPYLARGSGTILLDNIRLVRTDADGTSGESQWWPQVDSVTTTCLDLPGFLPEE